ncbi:MAG: hypothetical protein QM791_04785 [Ferruginibacter sp.]
MKKLCLFFVVVLFVYTPVDAKIRRVGFFASPVSGTDYATFAAAYAAAVNDDTILMFPSTTVSGTIAKKLMIIGPGNWLDPNSTPKGNANLQAFAGIATLGSVIFDPGSSGSVIQGFNDGTIFIKENNITVKRNRELTVYITYLNNTSTVTNLQVLQNYRVQLIQTYSSGSSTTNMNISNNLILRFYTPPGNTYNGNISNNVWAYDATTASTNGGASTFSSNYDIELGGGAYLLQNNIFLSYTNVAAASNYNYFTFTNGGNSVFNYNLAVQSSTAINWGTGTGNVITLIANAPNIFTAFPVIGTTSADARYQLKTGSPALTAGAGGTAIGMFAGNYPYKLSTIPTIPTIYALSSPQGNNPSGSTIQISVSTRGNN